MTAQPRFVIYGNVCCEAQVDQKLNTLQHMEARVRGADFEASIEDGALVGEAKVRGEEYELSLARSPRYGEPLTLLDLAGTYTRTTTPLLGPSATYTINVDPTGQFTASHTNGCVYNGTVVLPDAPSNLIKLDVTLANCPSTGSGSMNGQYTGLGVLFRDIAAPSDATKRTNVLYHSLVGPTWLGQQATER